MTRSHFHDSNTQQWGSWVRVPASVLLRDPAKFFVCNFIIIVVYPTIRAIPLGSRIRPRGPSSSSLKLTGWARLASGAAYGRGLGLVCSQPPPRRAPTDAQCSEYSARPPKRLLPNVEGRAHVGRGVGGASGSAAPEDHDDADDEQAHERAAEAGGEPPDKG